VFLLLVQKLQTERVMLISTQIAIFHFKIMVWASFILEKQKSFVLYIDLNYQIVFIEICYLYP
jgi:hypothetical protein